MQHYHHRKSVVALLLLGALTVLASTASSFAVDTDTRAKSPDTESQSARSAWGASYFPNVELTTHEGRKVRFFDDLIKDKVVVLNFIYTSCPDVCPLETARLAEVYAILKERVGKDIFLYSITIDPEVDTPQVLNDYAQRYHAGPGWTFLTGADADITLLRRKLGLYVTDLSSDNPNDHNISMLIGNQATGRWMKRSPFENPYVLAEQISGWLHNWKDPRGAKREYKDAPELRSLATGESLFRTRCAACHTVGGGDLRVSAGAIGPDLYGVVDRREREWLERWLYEPDVMISEGDPIATTLLEAFDNVPMPNLSLGPKDIAAVIEYMQTETRRVASTRVTDKVLAEIQAAAKPGESCCQKGTEGTVTDKKLKAAPIVRGHRTINVFASLIFLSGLTCALGVTVNALRERSGM